MSYILQTQISANAEHNDEQTQRHDVEASGRIFPVCIETAHEGRGGLYLSCTNYIHRSVISEELSHHEAFHDIVQRIQPVPGESPFRLTLERK